MVWKAFKYSLLVLVFASAAVAVYAWLDTAVSLDHARQQQKTERERSELLRQFVGAFNHGAKRSEVMQFVNRNFGKGHVIKEEEDKILVDGIVFRFDNTQSLTKVQFLGEDDE
jgi:hypothetical protein